MIILESIFENSLAEHGYLLYKGYFLRRAKANFKNFAWTVRYGHGPPFWELAPLAHAFSISRKFLNYKICAGLRDNRWWHDSAVSQVSLHDCISLRSSSPWIMMDWWGGEGDGTGTGSFSFPFLSFSKFILRSSVKFGSGRSGSIFKFGTKFGTNSKFGFGNNRNFQNSKFELRKFIFHVHSSQIFNFIELEHIFLFYYNFFMCRCHLCFFMSERFFYKHKLACCGDRTLTLHSHTVFLFGVSNVSFTSRYILWNILINHSETQWVNLLNSVHAI